MIYYCLVTISTPGFPHYIEVGINFKLPFHPNLTDKIEVLGFPCEIKEIYYTLEDVHNGQYATILLTAVDCLYCCETEEQALACLKSEWSELKKCHPDIILNDYTVNPKHESPSKSPP